MLAYAANRRRIAERQSSPNAMLFVACAHIVAIAVVLSIKMDLPRRILHPDPPIINVPLPPEPPPPTTTHQPAQSHLTTPTRPDVPLPPTSDDHPQVAAGSSGLDAGPIETGGAVSIPEFTVPPKPVSTGVQLLTPESDLRPPYPASKLLDEEEAALRLRLTIDQTGRVVAVDPVGSADPVFFSAARKHLLAHWRYKPATQDGRPIATSIVITLRFELNG
jgi:periplasmic protein TonB